MRQYRLLLSIALLVAGLTPLPAAAQHPTLTRGTPVQGTLAPGDTARFTATLGDSTFVLGAVDQRSVPVQVRVLDPEGTPRGSFQGPGTGRMRFSGVTAEAGAYTVEVIPLRDESGDFTLTLERVEPMARDPRRLTDQMMARFDGPESPGAVVRVWRNGRELYSKAYGMANLTYDIPYRTDTPTNIGSTSKQFTGFAVLLQAERGALSLEDDIRTHIPELPDLGDTIRVKHLLTHTSGLREFLNLLIMTGRRLDHGDWIDRSELIQIVQRQPALQNAPGGEFNYNNTAFGLAALIVERTSGQDFPDFMRENVFQPLGMTRTAVRPSPEHVVPGMSEGYTPGPDGWRQIGDLGGAMGAGGIYSTVEDLQRWGENLLAEEPRVGSREINRQMTTSFVLNDGSETGYGMGLFMDDQRGQPRIHHGGADVAHRSMLALYPEIDAGITTQSNHAGFNSNMAFDLAGAFFRDAMEPEEPRVAAVAGGDFDPESYDAEDFDDFVGRYALDAAPNFILSFFREGDTLYTQATGQQRIEIVPTSDTTFRLTVVEASVVFHRDPDGEVRSATLLQNGEQRATRLPDDGAQPGAWTPTPDELAAFVGRFYSAELETFYTFVVEDGALVLKQRRMEDAPLEPGGERDSFTGRNLSFTFERDRNGQVTGFYVANARTRDVRFGRVVP